MKTGCWSASCHFFCPSGDLLSRLLRDIEGDKTFTHAFPPKGNLTEKSFTFNFLLPMKYDLQRIVLSRYLITDDGFTFFR